MPTGYHNVRRGHLCLTFEKLDVNLFELLKRNGFRGLSLRLLQRLLGQMLDALAVMRDAAVIHCDLKPENILIKDATSGMCLGASRCSPPVLARFG